MTYSHTMPIDIAGNQVQVEFEFSCTPFYSATGPSYESGGQPGEGGEVEIDSAVLLIEKQDKTVERIDAPKWLLDILGNDEDVTEHLGASCDWCRDDGLAADEAYERMRDEREFGG